MFGCYFRCLYRLGVGYRKMQWLVMHPPSLFAGHLFCVSRHIRLCLKNGCVCPAFCLL